MWSVNPSPGIRRSLIWRALDGLSFEHFEFVQPFANHVHFNGTVISVQNGAPSRSFYFLEANDQWQTQHVRVGHENAMLELIVRDGRWFTLTHDHRTHSVSEQELPALMGCQDVDLGLTPATNTLPIRRLNLEIGEAATLTAAWVKFPSLEMLPLEQRYERLSEFSYRYSSTNFETLLEVDELGLITRYEGGWEQVAVSSFLMP
jgi:uncharacterized protein